MSLEKRPRAEFLIFENDTETHAGYLRALVAYPRGSLGEPKVVGAGSGGPEPVSVVAQENEIEIVWPDPVIAPGEAVKVAVRTDSPLAVAGLTWLPEGEPCLPWRPSTVPRPDEEPGVTTTGGGSEGGKNCTEFFAEYDRRFLPADAVDGGFDGNPKMTREQQAERRRAIEGTLRTLVRRRNARARAAKNGDVPGAGDLPRPPRDLVEHLSDAQLALFRECFPDGDGGIDYRALQKCFEKFANGELRTGAKPGEREPDGGFFFLFAEFAFLAVATAVDSGPWSRLLRTFVKTQEIFVEVYFPYGLAEPELDDFRASNFDRSNQVDEQKKRELRERYDELSPGELERRARENLKNAQTGRPI